MKIKCLRIFAGPNGSGKSTFIAGVQAKPPVKNFKLGLYVNADDIEKELKKTKKMPFSAFGIEVSTSEIKRYFKKSTFAPVKLKLPDLWKYFSVENNILKIEKELKINSYVAADIAEFIRVQILRSDQSFSYETVMSDERKIAFLRKAKRAGYRIYLYFFCTEDPMLNVGRVQSRVAQDGHNVNKETIEKRYFKSLQNLLPAIKLSHRAYLFDNSKQVSVLIAEITKGKQVSLVYPELVPGWFVDYVFNKSKTEKSVKRQK
ncbi:MAG: hypothetical protein ACKOXB_14095 [Flavobacteriales bacterium]